MERAGARERSSFWVAATSTLPLWRSYHATGNKSVCPLTNLTREQLQRYESIPEGIAYICPTRPSRTLAGILSVPQQMSRESEISQPSATTFSTSARRGFDGDASTRRDDSQCMRHIAVKKESSRTMAKFPKRVPATRRAMRQRQWKMLMSRFQEKRHVGPNDDVVIVLRFLGLIVVVSWSW